MRFNVTTRAKTPLEHTAQVVFYDRLGAFLVLGWFLHFFPFFIMSRQLFLHHYFPALYFAVSSSISLTLAALLMVSRALPGQILLLACAFDLATSMLKPRIRLQIVAIVIIATVWTYWHFSPLTYAGMWTRAQCEKAKWRKNWDFSW